VESSPSLRVQARRGRESKDTGGIWVHPPEVDPPQGAAEGGERASAPNSGQRFDGIADTDGKKGPPPSSAHTAR
jgi:hypothetical protein